MSRRRFAHARLRTTTVGVVIVGGPWDGLSFTVAGDPDDLDYQIPLADVGGYQLDDIAVWGKHGRVVYRWLPARPPVLGRPVADVSDGMVEYWWGHMCHCPSGFGEPTEEPQP